MSSIRLRRRALLAVALTGAIAGCERKPPAVAWPQEILPDLAWSLAEPLQASPASLLEALQAYAAISGTRVDVVQLQTRFPGGSLDIHYSYMVHTASGASIETTGAVRIRQIEAPTYLDILFALHQAAQPYMRDQDHRYFEGLSLLPLQLEPGVPIYELRTGS